MLAGALADPVDSALFIWKDSSQEVMQQPHTLHAALCQLMSMQHVSGPTCIAADVEIVQEIEQFVENDVYTHNKLVADW